MNKLVRPVVVGVNGTDESLQAVRYGVQEARRRGCGVRLVHVVPQLVATTPMLPLISVETLDAVGTRLVHEARQLAYDLTGGQVTVETAVRSGAHVSELARECDTACLGVLGRQSRSRLGRIFGGSTSSGLAGRSSSPIVTVPSAWRSNQRYGRVLVGVEHAHHDTDTLAAAFDAARQRGAELTVLHAWSLPNPYEVLLTEAEVDDWRRRLRESIQHQVDKLQNGAGDLPVTVEVPYQRAVQALVQASRDVDLVVLGRHGHHAVWQAHLGSVTRAVMREAHAPVETTPSQGATRFESMILTADEISPQT
jgi:nucleotide-binding universal stress UspA family protein